MDNFSDEDKEILQTIIDRYNMNIGGLYGDEARREIRIYQSFKEKKGSPFVLNVLNEVVTDLNLEEKMQNKQHYYEVIAILSEPRYQADRLLEQSAHHLAIILFNDYKYINGQKVEVHPAERIAMLRQWLSDSHYNRGGRLKKVATEALKKLESTPTESRTLPLVQSLVSKLSEVLPSDFTITTIKDPEIKENLAICTAALYLMLNIKGATPTGTGKISLRELYIATLLRFTEKPDSRDPEVVALVGSVVDKLRNESLVTTPHALEVMYILIDATCFVLDRTEEDLKKVDLAELAKMLRSGENLLTTLVAELHPIEKAEALQFWLEEKENQPFRGLVEVAMKALEELRAATPPVAKARDDDDSQSSDVSITSQRL